MSKLSMVSSALASCAPSLSARFRKNQAHIYDVLGPFPDEPLTLALDRVLYYSGAQKLQKLFNWSTAVDGCTKAHNCEVVESAKTAKTCCCKQENCTDFPLKPSKPSCVFKCKKRSALGKCSTHSKQRTVRVDFANSVICDKNETKAKPDFDANIEAILSGSTGGGGGCAAIGAKLKRSFSLCSLACRRIKNKCASHSRCCASGDNGEGKWLWTRLVTQDDGSKVYELYDDSSLKTDPSSIDCAKGPKVIFVMLPNGNIMQFEGLACH